MQKVYDAYGVNFLFVKVQSCRENPCQGECYKEKTGFCNYEFFAINNGTCHDLERLLIEICNEMGR